MSQYPNPWGAPPPPGQPPMEPGQYPFQPVPPAPRSNGIAVASLVCGLIACVPFLPSLLAVLFGWIGLRRTKDPRVGGKGLAIAGLILGLLGVAGWGLASGGMYMAMKGSGPAKDLTRGYLADLANGDIDSAMTKVNPDAMTRSMVENQMTFVQGQGAIQDSMFFGAGFEISPGQKQWKIAGAIMFSGSKRELEADVEQLPDGRLRLVSVQIR